MLMEKPILSFIHISDTHLMADPAFNLPDLSNTPQEGADSLKAAIQALPIAVDFILHTGDVVNEPSKEAYLRARAFFHTFEIPIHFLSGNHDDPALQQQFLLQRQEVKLPFCYEFEQAGIQFIALDSHQPNTNAGKLGTEQLEWLRERCSAADDRPLIVALHHNPLQAPPSPWWDNMALRDGEALHQTLLRAKDRLRGVFFGHIHQPLQYYRDGILYAAACGSWELLHYYPDMQDFLLDHESLPSFNLVHIGPRTTTIRRHSFRVPLTQNG